MENLFAKIPAGLPQELVQTILSHGSFRIERIVSQGHASPEGFWYDQEQHELVFVLQGAARLQFSDGFRELKVGDYVDIPAHCRHRVDWTAPNEPTIWLAVFYG